MARISSNPSALLAVYETLTRDTHTDEDQHDGPVEPHSHTDYVRASFDRAAIEGTGKGGVSAGAIRSVYGAMLGFAHYATGLTFVSVERLVLETNMGERTVKRALAVLRNHGWLYVIRRGRKAKGTTRQYLTNGYEIRAGVARISSNSDGLDPRVPTRLTYWSVQRLPRSTPDPLLAGLDLPWWEQRRKFALMPDAHNHWVGMAEQSRALAEMSAAPGLKWNDGEPPF